MRIIDTGDKILSGDNHPQLKIGDRCYLVDDRKSTFEKIQEIQKRDDLEDYEKEEAVFELALGKEAVKELLTDDMTVQGFSALSFYIMAAITGEDYDELRKAAKENIKN